MSIDIMPAPVLPTITPETEIDPALGDTLGDEILLDSARTTKAAKVVGGRRSPWQSHTARAWTMGGQVD
jgi:hypothetical protein